MKESAEQFIPIYSSVEDDEQFKLITLTIETSSDKPLWVRRKPCPLVEIFRRWKAAQEEEQDQGELGFYFSCLILTIAEIEQRRLLKRRIQPNSRNIRLSTETTINYLKQVLKKAAREGEHPNLKFTDISPKDKKKLTPKFNTFQLDEWIQEAFVVVKQKLGFPETSPIDCVYEVNPEVEAAAISEECIKYLKTLRTREYILPRELENICQTLKEKFSDDADNVIEALMKTKSRDHICVLSITTEQNNTYVSMVNEKGSHIKMESWLFLMLIEEADTALRLHEFKKKKWESPDDPFVFDTHKEGHVIGRFIAIESRFEVACIDPNSKALSGQAAFLVDITYVLCIYTTLKRLEQDRERFHRLRNKARTAIPVENPFLTAYRPYG